MKGSVLMSGIYIQPHSGKDMICSQSYLAGVALTPDNYLVSPRVFLGGTFSFWASAQDASYAAEHFGVSVSTASQTDPSDFVTVQEWTMTAKSDEPNSGMPRSGNRTMGAWYQYTVDLSAYEGQMGYIAIRHFDCFDMYYLDVDDVYYEITGTSELGWTIVPDIENNYYTLMGLDDMSDYVVQVRSSCGDGENYSNWVEVGFSNIQYTVNALVEPEECGSVNGAGTYFKNESCVLEAQPAEGCTFVNWTENGKQVSTSSSYAFTVTDDRELVAQLAAERHCFFGS